MAQSIGLLAGGLIGLRFRPRRMLLAGNGAMLLAPLLLVALGWPLALPIVLLAAFLAGVGVQLFGTLWDTTMQQEIPDAALSRVYAYDMLGSVAVVPVGLAVAGPIADAIGVQATLWVGAAVAAVATLLVFGVGDVRKLERTSRTSVGGWRFAPEARVVEGPRANSY